MIADPVASVAMSRASSIINNFNKLLSVEKKGLDEIKNEINTALLNIDIKIIIVIDDLDRLADTDIQEIFQLVRSIADFKNTIYILSYDEEIVSKALDKIQKDKGGKYIEKIVQVPIKLPKVSQENLKDIFIKKLKTIHIKHEALDKDEFIKKIKENNFEKFYIVCPRNKNFTHFIEIKHFLCDLNKTMLKLVPYSITNKLIRRK
ncbi:hypothetical protein MK749_000284 [Campylobacter coli]|nr:hypothetical protein [Campylobacter coli]